MNVPKFLLTNLLTLDCSFQRAEILTESFANTVPEIELKLDLEHDGDIVKVYLTTDVTQSAGDHRFLNGQVKMLGIFQKTGEMSEQTINSFCNINAPAILFPFVRETISSLSVRAGLRPIVLQPINFVDLNSQSRQEQLNEGE